MKGEMKEQSGGKGQKKKEEDRCDSHWVFCMHLWIEAGEEKYKKKWGKAEEHREEESSSLFNLNPKSTGLLKHERLGSNSAFASL